ncbi:MAG: hypothetical protein ACSLEY_00655 [Candidatus Saccharimonadales bacterium]
MLHGVPKTVGCRTVYQLLARQRSVGLYLPGNTDIIYRISETIDIETQAVNLHVFPGSGINIKFSPLSGRNFEYFNKDSILSGEIAVAHIKGINTQGVDTSLQYYTANN